MQIKAPYVFDWEHGIAVHAMQRNRASSLAERDVAYFLLSCSVILGYIFEFRRDWPFEIRLLSVKSALLSSYDGHLRNLI